MSEVTTEGVIGDEFKNWQRKFLMHCLWVAKNISHETGIASAIDIEAAGEPLLFGLAEKVRKVIDAKGKA